MPANAQFVQDGRSIDYTPGSEVACGDVVVSGNLVGIAQRKIPANELGALDVEGVFELPKATGGGTAIAFGAEVFWDAGNTRVDDDPTVGKRLGVCVLAAADAATTVRVKLDPSAAGQEPASTTAYGVVKQAAAVANLTDSTTGTSDGTLANVGTAVTGVDGTGSNAASKADVDARLTAINNNFADLAAKVNALLAAQRTAGQLAT